MALDMSKITIEGFLKKFNKGASARRCLFGPVNHEENQRVLREQLALQEKESRNRWNFDFVNEKPVEGKYRWEKVQVIDENSVPVAYALPHLVAPTPCKARINLTFNSRMNFKSTENIADKTSEVNQTSPALERKPATTVPVRDETPPSSSSVLSTSSNTSPVSSCDVTTSVNTQGKSSLKRKASQADITEFFPVKKTRNIVTASSAKRRLDL